ncbi:MAG TPA: hypothetical protein VF824_18210 [Thermoanaerobaculia bacterium]|jgi:hypothetical protein
MSTAIMQADTRITLVASERGKSSFGWSDPSRLALGFVRSVSALKEAVASALTTALDVERVVVDRTGKPDEFLDLLASLPTEFAGDAILIREDGSGYLSATGRGGDRVLYALKPNDVRFYLETHALVPGS